MWKRTSGAVVALAAVVVAVASLGVLYATPDYTGINAEVGNQLSSAPGLLSGLAGPIIGVTMLFVGFFFAVRAIRRAVH
jgi:TRAP-type C4-dicarboxylate transport system permease small subunit